MESWDVADQFWKFMQVSPPGADYQHEKASSAEVNGHVAALDMLNLIRK